MHTSLHPEVKKLRRWIPTGSSSLDQALEGGLPPASITLLYGEAETSKSTLAMQCAVSCSRIGFKTLYIDSEGTFLPERLSQISPQDFEEVSESIIVARPQSFAEQTEIIDNIERYVNKRFGLVVFDTVTSLYRSELLNKKETFDLNRELNRQVAILLEIARKNELSVLLVSQVRSVVVEAEVAPVATRVLKFWSDSIIGLSRTGRHGVIRASIEKSGGKEARTSFYLIIREEGVHDYDVRISGAMFSPPATPLDE
jgi:RecA/RadA recombinase